MNICINIPNPKGAVNCRKCSGALSRAPWRAVRKRISHTLTDNCVGPREAIPEIICPRVNLLYPHQASDCYRSPTPGTRRSQAGRTRRDELEEKFAFGAPLHFFWVFASRAGQSPGGAEPKLSVWQTGAVKPVHTGSLSTARNWQRWFGDGSRWTLDIPNNNLCYSG